MFLGSECTDQSLSIIYSCIQMPLRGCSCVTCCRHRPLPMAAPETARERAMRTLSELAAFPNYFPETQLWLTTIFGWLALYLCFRMVRQGVLQRKPPIARAARLTEHLVGIALSVFFLANVYYKLSMGLVYACYLLYPCHSLSIACTYTLTRVSLQLCADRLLHRAVCDLEQEPSSCRVCLELADLLHPVSSVGTPVPRHERRGVSIPDGSLLDAACASGVHAADLVLHQALSH